MLRFPVLSVVLGLWALVTTSHGAAVRDRHVSAELVPAVASIEPGTPFTVGLRLRHDPHWHTYWKASTTGYATSLNWDLPPGFTAGKLQWPVPRTYEFGGLVEFVYEGTVILPVTITPPDELEPNMPVTLRARAEWLMCADICVPGGADLAVELPVRSESPEPANAEAFTATAERLPLEVVDGLELAAWQEGETIALAVQSPNGELPADLYYFDAQSFLTPTMEQAWERPSPELAILRQTVDPAGMGVPEGLSGVLAARDGSWVDDAARPGLAVDVAWSEKAPAFADGESETAASAADGTAPRGLFATLALGFLGGLILNLMPCVFPVIGIKIMGFVNQAGEARRKVAQHGLTFTAGVLVSFWMLAGLLILLRSGGEQLGWGFQLQDPVFVFFLAGFLLVFALNMSGVFEFGTSAMGVGSQLSSKSGLAGSFFSGVLATVVATPCAAPMLAPALGAALRLDPLPSLGLFTIIALGLSTPYLLLSVFPGLLKHLPRPGAWMESFKQGMAFLLYATVGYLVWILVGQMVEDQGFLPDALLGTLLGLVLLAVASWIFGRWAASHRPTSARRIGLAIALFVAAGGIYLGYPQPAFDADASATSDAPPVSWEKWEPGKAAALAAEGKLVYVDFTARWCATCQVNKKAVFTSAEVRRYFAAHGVVALKADWTNHDPAIAEALAAFDRAAVPFNLIYAPGQAEPRTLPELLTPGVVLEALRAVNSSSDRAQRPG